MADEALTSNFWVRASCVHTRKERAERRSHGPQTTICCNDCAPDTGKLGKWKFDTSHGQTGVTIPEFQTEFVVLRPDSAEHSPTVSTIESRGLNSDRVQRESMNETRQYKGRGRP